MAVKIKESIHSTPYQPRFDFDNSQAPNDASTATIKELLYELNRQKGNDSIADYNLKSLGTTLRFVSAISSIGAPRRVDQAFPVAAIKTIKLLFKCSQFIDAHLIRVIGIPGENTPVTIDFFTSPATSKTEDVKRQISRIISSLEREIDKDEIAAIDEICDPMRLREKFLQGTNEAVDKILLTHIHINDDLVKEADGYLADKTREFLDSIAPLKRELRLHVATYTYLKLLDYVHRLHFEISTRLTIPNDRGVANKQVDFSEICRKLSDYDQESVKLDTNFMSIDDVGGFINDHASDIAQLVSDTVGVTYNKRDVLVDSMRAMVALQLYLLAAGLPSERNAKPIGIAHVVAAYCSVLHQRKSKSKSEKKSRKYGSKLSSPQKLLDGYIARSTTHIPWTVGFIYMERTKWYVHALLGMKDKADSNLSVKIAQSELTRDIFMSLDHTQIRKHISAYREFMTKAAHDFVTLHDKQDTKYEWSHGG
jgi:hypothetical protein